MESNETVRAAECLRMALPLMGKFAIPVTPRNYAVWFDYVAGTNPPLKERLDSLIESGETLDERAVDSLYRDHVAGAELKLAEQAREALRRLLTGASGSFADVNVELEHFTTTLESIGGQLGADTDEAQLRGYLDELTVETRSVRDHGARLQVRLQSSQDEIEELRRELEEVRRQATTDALTGLANRGAFDKRAEELAERSAAAGTPFGLLLLDIDKFKAINDTHGHLVGDKVIRFVAKVIVDSVKGKDLVARYGGEEYAVLLPETSRSGCLAVAETVREAVERSRLVKSGTGEAIGKVTISGGLSIFRAGERVAALVERADVALYQSKRNGRNRVTAESDSEELSQAG